MLNRICRFPSADNKGKQLKLTYVLLLSQLSLIVLGYMQLLPRGQKQYQSISNKGRVILMTSEPQLWIFWLLWVYIKCSVGLQVGVELNYT